MSILDTIAQFWNGILQSLGLAAMDRTVVFLGLDNAGKTTLLHKLKHGSVRQFVPTERGMTEQVVVGKLTLQAWDLGGHEQVRRLWRDYYTTADAVLFLVDASDRQRFVEAQKELKGLLGASELQDVPVAVLANKSDVSGCATVDELVQGLEIQGIHDGKVQVFRTSVVEGWGYLEAFNWLSTVL